jgi:hypothetical protein
VCGAGGSFANWNFTPAGFVPLGIDDLDGLDLTVEERLAIVEIVAGQTQNRGPFSKIG